jgi:hypothetical protein
LVSLLGVSSAVGGPYDGHNRARARQEFAMLEGKNWVWSKRDAAQMTDLQGRGAAKKTLGSVAPEFAAWGSRCEVGTRRSSMESIRYLSLEGLVNRQYENLNIFYQVRSMVSSKDGWTNRFSRLSAAQVAVLGKGELRWWSS